MHLIQIMFYKQKNPSICLSPFITKEMTVLTYYTHCLTILALSLWEAFISHEAQTQIRISLKSILLNYTYMEIFDMCQPQFPFCSSSTTVLSTLLTWIVKKLKWEKLYLRNHLHVYIALKQYMLTLAHSVYLDHNRNKKTFPYPHMFQHSHHRF